MNGNNLNTKFEELFRDFSEEPSSSCWDAISRKLDVVMPGPGSSASAQSAGGFSKFVTSAIGKTVAAFTGISLAGVIAYSVIHPSSFDPVDEKGISAPQSVQSQSVGDKKEAVNQSVKKDANRIQPVEIVEETLRFSTRQDLATPFSAENPITPTRSSESEVSEVQIAVGTTPPNVVQNEEKMKEEPTPSTETDAIAEPINENTIVETNETNAQAENPRSLNIDIPNVLTPNGDGFNDLFVIKNIESVPANRLVVVNEVGMKVFEANNYQNNWDAANAPDGAYYYVLETKIDGIAQTFYGVIQILR